MTQSKPKQPTRTKQRIVIEVPPELKHWLEQHCQDHGHTATWIITRLLERYRQEQETK